MVKGLEFMNDQFWVICVFLKPDYPTRTKSGKEMVPQRKKLDAGTRRRGANSCLSDKNNRYPLFFVLMCFIVAILKE